MPDKQKIKSSYVVLALTAVFAVLTYGARSLLDLLIAALNLSSLAAFGLKVVAVLALVAVALYASRKLLAYLEEKGITKE